MIEANRATVKRRLTEQAPVFGWQVVRSMNMTNTTCEIH